MHIAEIEIMLNESYEFLKLEYTYVFNFWPTDPFLSLAFHFHESSTINEVGKICRLYSILQKFQCGQYGHPEPFNNSEPRNISKCLGYGDYVTCRLLIITLSEV